jgi:hypothetical protein
MKATSKQPAVVLGFRNHRGEQVTPASVQATVAKNTLLARMQKPGAGRRMHAAFSATPAQLGRAAVAAARKRD